jgi:hypothetical protein
MQLLVGIEHLLRPSGGKDMAHRIPERCVRQTREQVAPGWKLVEPAELDDVLVDRVVEDVLGAIPGDVAGRVTAG